MHHIKYVEICKQIYVHLKRVDLGPRVYHLTKLALSCHVKYHRIRFSGF